jgi:hypothetical protein
MPLTYQKITTVTVGAGGAASIDFTSIPDTFTDLVVKWSTRNNSGRQVTFKLNNATTNQTYRIIYGDGSGVATESGTRIFGYSNGSGTTANTFCNGEAYIPNYAGSNNKSISIDSVEENNATGAYMVLSANLWSSSSAINQVTVIPHDGTSFNQYSTATLYGIKKD